MLPSATYRQAGVCVPCACEDTLRYASTAQIEDWLSDLPGPEEKVRRSTAQMRTLPAPWSCLCQTRDRSRLAIGTKYLLDQPQGQRASPTTGHHQWLPTLPKRFRTPGHSRELDGPSTLGLADGRDMVSRRDDVWAPLYTESLGQRSHRSIFGVGYKHLLHTKPILLTE